MIEGRSICKKFGERILFDRLSFSIADGEFVCFSGVSGAGKTTLLNIIGLLEPIDSGTLLINGKRYLKAREKRQYYSTEVGFLFQNFALIENKTIEENLEIVAPKNRTDYSMEEVLNKVGLADKIHNKVYTLSGGEQQRVALARLYFKQCKIILADEPTGSLDHGNAQIVMKMLKELNASGKTVIFVTHDEEIRKMASRVIEL